jgi:hypothetical protein
MLILCLALFLIGLIILLGSMGKESAYVYVRYVDGEGIVGDVDGLGTVYFEMKGADESFELFDTLRVTWRKGTVREESGSVTDGKGQAVMEHGGQIPYDCRIKVSTARRSIPALGEPLYG